MTTTGTVRLAAVVYDAGFKIDDFLGRIAGMLRADRTNLAGVLQENARDDTGVCSAMTLVDLGSQRRFRISQDLGTQAEAAASMRRVSPKLARCSTGRSAAMSNF